MVSVNHHHAEYKPILDPEDDHVVDFTGHKYNHSHSHHGLYKHIVHSNGPLTMIDEGVCISQFPQEVIDDE